MHRSKASNQSILLNDKLSDIGSACVLLFSTDSCHCNLNALPMSLTGLYRRPRPGFRRRDWERTRDLFHNPLMCFQ
jgi:hypothetical protein